MKQYTTITDSEFSMGFVNLSIRLLFQRFLVFSSKEVPLHIANKSSFWPFKIALQKFSVDNFASFCRRVPYIHYGLLSSYFCIQECSGFHYLSLHSTARGRFFPFVFSGHTHFFIIL